MEMTRERITKALAKIGFTVGAGVPQIMNNKGKWLPFFVNLNTINTSATGEGWSFHIHYDDLKIREMKDNDGNISAICLMINSPEDMNKADTFLMFHGYKD